MTHKRHYRHPQTPSLDPETGEPVDRNAAPLAASEQTDAATAAAGPAAGDGESPVPPPSSAPSELEALKDRHLRLAADYDNFRKRTTKERAETWTRAQAELVTRLVDVLDDLARFAHVDPSETDAKTLREGVELVERKLWKDLEAVGVTRVDAAGVPFDPHVHEAVATQPAAKPEDDHTVGQVVQPGYKMRDTLLRPARVVVLTWQGQ